VNDFCSHCLTRDNGEVVGDDFICFGCKVLSRGDEQFDVLKDEIGWWLRKLHFGKGNRWVRVSIDENYAYDTALERFVAKLVVR
jgi:hypothetical protein